MAKKYFRLKDTGTTFYDVSQGKGLVADRVAELELTETVRRAKSRNVIEEVGEAEAKEAVSKQEEEYKAQEEARIAASTTVVVTTQDKARSKDSEAGKQTIEGGSGTSSTVVFDKDTDEFNAATILEGNVTEVTDSLEGLTADQLNTLKTAEQGGQNRKGVISAIDAELSKQKGSKPNLSDI